MAIFMGHIVSMPSWQYHVFNQNKSISSVHDEIQQVILCDLRKKTSGFITDR